MMAVLKSVGAVIIPYAVIAAPAIEQRAIQEPGLQALCEGLSADFGAGSVTGAAISSGAAASYASALPK
jgi:hypothetical protein